MRATDGPFEIDFRILTEGEEVRWVSSRGQGNGGDIKATKMTGIFSMSPDASRPRNAGRLSRWRSALTTIATLHGIDGIERALSLLGVSDADVPQSALDAALSVARR